MAGKNADTTGSEIVVADARRLPFRSDSMDSVICLSVLDIVDPMQDALGEIRRVLKPGGHLINMQDLAQRESLLSEYAGTDLVPFPDNGERGEYRGIRLVPRDSLEDLYQVVDPMMIPMVSRFADDPVTAYDMMDEMSRLALGRSVRQIRPDDGVVKYDSHVARLINTGIAQAGLKTVVNASKSKSAVVERPPWMPVNINHVHTGIGFVSYNCDPNVFFRHGPSKVKAVSEVHVNVSRKPS